MKTLAKVLVVAVLATVVVALVGCGGNGYKPATPLATTLVWANPAAISYGTALSATQLNAVALSMSASVPGTYTYTPAAGTVLQPGTQTLSLSFTPSDPSMFQSATATVSIVVNKANPVLTWANPASMPLGTPLTTTQLNAVVGANLPGVLTYTPSLGTLMGAPGAQTLSVAFAPTDTVHYNNVTATASVVVNTASDSCAALNGLAIPPSQIGLATTGGVITSATFTAAVAGSKVEYCKLVGVIHPVNAQETVISVYDGTSTVVPTEDITFNVSLPTAWNNKTIGVGGGGFDGSVPATDSANTTTVTPNIVSPLNRGYAVWASNSGHTSAAMPTTLWNSEALRNFGREAIKKTHDAAVYVTNVRYGFKPTYSYFQGGSQGGHEAMIAASFYPTDFDGVLVGYPAYNLEAMHPGSIDYGKALYNSHTATNGYNVPGDAGYGWISRQQMAAVSNYIINGVLPSGPSWAGCDALDMAIDGLVSNPGDPACVAHKNLMIARDGTNPLRCTTIVGGYAVHTVPVTDAAYAGELCLSDVQIETLTRLTSRYPLYKTVASQNTPFVAEGGITSYAKWPILDGIWFAKDATKDNSQEDFGNAYNDFSAFQASFPTTDQVQMLTQRAWTAAQVAASFDINDPRWYPARLQQVSSWLDTNNIDYEVFRGRGGKMIHYAGHSDVSIASFNNVDLTLRMRGQFVDVPTFTPATGARNSAGTPYIGDSPFWGANFDFNWNANVPQRRNVTVSGGIVDDFYTFYYIPGMGHGHGYFTAVTDWLSALENWRERDAAPRNSLVMTDTSTAHTSLGTRPLCYFPYYARYTGAVGGDITLASNYTCTKQDAFANVN